MAELGPMMMKELGELGGVGDRLGFPQGLEEPGPLWAKTDGAEETPVICEMSVEHPEIVFPAVTLQSFCSPASRCRQFATFGSVPAGGPASSPSASLSHLDSLHLQKVEDGPIPVRLKDLCRGGGSRKRVSDLHFSLASLRLSRPRQKNPQRVTNYVWTGALTLKSGPG